MPEHLSLERASPAFHLLTSVWLSTRAHTARGTNITVKLVGVPASASRSPPSPLAHPQAAVASARNPAPPSFACT